MDDKKFCYWDILNEGDLIFVCINLFICSIITCLIIRMFLKAKRMFATERPIMVVFYFLIAWGITYLLQYTFCIIMYTKYKDCLQHDFTTYSKIFDFLDSFPAFIIQLLLLFIPYIMVRNIYNICKESGYQITKAQQMKLKIFKGYQFFRFIIIIPDILLLIVDPQDLNKTSYILLLMVCGDAVICYIFLFVSVINLIQKYYILRIGGQKPQQRLKYQYIALSLSGLCRCMMDIVFQVSTQRQCQITQDRWVYTIGYLFFGQIGMHFLPALVMLKMYQVPNSNQNEESSFRKQESQLFQQQKDINKKLIYRSEN